MTEQQSHYPARNFFFFFQAEDGIRDTSVTGVQTCALPICQGPRIASLRAADADTKAEEVRRAELLRDRAQAVVPGESSPHLQLEPAEIEVALVRSEERRVGKECRPQWSPCHEKKESSSCMA